MESEATARSFALAQDDNQKKTALRRRLILLAAITLLGSVLRLLYLGSKSLWQDEAVSVFIARLSGAEFRHILWNHELNMAAYYGLLRFWLRLGSDEFTLRSLSALAGIATLPVIYFLGRRMFGSRAGWVAALLLAVHPSHIAYSQEARGYTLVVLFCALSSWFFVHVIGSLAEPRPDSGEKPSAAWVWVGYVAASVLAVYSHFFAVLVIAAQWLTLIFWRSFSNQQMALGRREWRRGWWLSALAIAALLSPAAWFVVTRNVGQLDWVPPITLKETLHLIFFLTGNGIRFILYMGLWIVAAWQAKGLARAQNEDDKTPERRLFYAFVVLWLLFPVLITIGVSLWKPVMAPRFLLICVPAAVLFAAAGSAGFSKRWNVVWVTLLALASLNSVISYYRRPREDWRAATNYVLSNATTGDALVIVPEYGHFPFDYYEQRYLEHNPRAGTGVALPVMVPSSDFAKAGDAFPYRRTWLVIYQPETMNPEKRSAMERLTTQSGQPYGDIKSATREFTAIEVRLLERNRTAPGKER